MLLLLLDTHLFTGPCAQLPGRSAAAAAASSRPDQQHSTGPSGRHSSMQRPVTMLDQVLYFVGAYRLLNDSNQLAVFAMQEDNW